MSEKKELNQEQLEKVSGGNSGDSASEGASSSDKINYLYDLFDEVEVYDNTWSNTTKPGKVINRRPIYVYGKAEFNGAHYIGQYQIWYLDAIASGHSQEEWVIADQIKR